MRHTARSGDQPTHEIREILNQYLLKHKLMDGRSDSTSNKQLHWHIDYLLDHNTSELINIALICSRTRIERRAYYLLSGMDEVEIVERGIGASDSRDATHFWRINETNEFWAALNHELANMINHSVS
jgi:Uri superfamily endonuclease